eukprot:726867-Pleurochrysis_carterae.AAC.2
MACLRSLSAVVAMWYKPCSAQPHLHPSAKDKNGQPIEEPQTVNGDKVYAVCPYGIEIFKTKEVLQGLPLLAPFAKSLTNSNLPRFDIAHARASTMSILDILKDRFTEADRTEWKTFFDEYPKKVDDIPDERMHRFTSSSLPPCGMTSPDGTGLSNHSARYSESIRYVNVISRHSTTDRSLRNARDEAKDVPILEKGSLICVLPPADVLADPLSLLGDRLPFWIGCVMEDEEAIIGAQCLFYYCLPSNCCLHAPFVPSLCNRALQLKLLYRVRRFVWKANSFYSRRGHLRGAVAGRV